MEQDYEQQDNSLPRPVKIGITHGDTNGIGYEIILKSLQDSRIFEIFTPILYGSAKLVSYHRKSADMTDFQFHIIRSAEQAQPGKANLINIHPNEIRVDLGEATEESGKAAFDSLEMAMDDLLQGKIEALVTAPINKQNIQREGFSFPGHTEYLAQKAGVSDSLMLMVGQDFRIGVATGHIPLNEVADQLSVDLILLKIRLMNQSLRRDFGIRKPRIAVLGLNPHAGDMGVIGKQEQELLIPAVQRAFDEGIHAFGPYPADGFFGSSGFRDFDGILAMYHDQGLIPFKLLSFKSGVNFTVGLPFVRTSPAHGTAYDIAGKNQASPEAFREALYLAVDVVRNRQLYDEITENPLGFSVLKDDSDSDRNDLKDLPEDNQS